MTCLAARLARLDSLPFPCFLGPGDTLDTVWLPPSSPQHQLLICLQGQKDGPQSSSDCETRVRHCLPWRIQGPRPSSPGQKGGHHAQESPRLPVGVTTGVEEKKRILPKRLRWSAVAESPRKGTKLPCWKARRSPLTRGSVLSRDGLE